ncbi:T9SS type A sorting domain-containing protein, partial [candidate division KSB1 bacterium]|nr:T9SS type A sorting domain-containing protein [candidate division KSB1 bacterium]
LMPLANLMRLVWWWECDYGYAEHYQTTMGLLPMAEANVITAMEQHHSYTYLCEYLQLGRDVLPQAAIELVERYLRQTPQVLYYTLAPHLPAGAVISGPTLYDSWNDRSLMIPLEDLREGWQKSGILGQQIYGAGAALVMAAEQATAVRQPQPKEPQDWHLANFPNPFNGGTTFCYRVSRNGEPVSLAIYNVLGQCVEILVDAPHAAGTHMKQWRPPETIGGGIYWAVLQGTDESAVLKFLYLH